MSRDGIELNTVKAFCQDMTKMRKACADNKCPFYLVDARACMFYEYELPAKWDMRRMKSAYRKMIKLMEVGRWWRCI